MQNRLKRYNVEKWAKEFLSSLKETENLNNTSTTIKLLGEHEENLVLDFQALSKFL